MVSVLGIFASKNFQFVPFQLVSVHRHDYRDDQARSLGLKRGSA